MKTFHTNLKKRWGSFSTFFQLANIGIEVERALEWRRKKNIGMSKTAFYRALELIDFTIDHKKNTSTLKEVCRMRELLVDYFIGDNQYHSSDLQWKKYFYPFNFAARNG